TGGKAVLTLVLKSRPAATVTIPIISSDETEGKVSPDILSFTPEDWNSTKTVTVTGVDDSVDDGDMAYMVNIGPAVSADPTYNGLDPDDVLVINRDNDNAQENNSSKNEEEETSSCFITSALSGWRQKFRRGDE
ncbi:MAG: hypothetical protein AB1649_25325, partial [Chloroflexota bacterium]